MDPHQLRNWSAIPNTHNCRPSRFILKRKLKRSADIPAGKPTSEVGPYCGCTRTVPYPP
jgi:hypothetical protein